jgi:hypothetical protein
MIIQLLQVRPEGAAAVSHAAANMFGRRRGNDKVEFQDYTKHIEGISWGCI